MRKYQAYIHKKDHGFSRGLWINIARIYNIERKIETMDNWWYSQLKEAHYRLGSIVTENLDK